jgi:hypothetical protein
MVSHWSFCGIGQAPKAHPSQTIDLKEGMALFSPGRANALSLMCLELNVP